MKIRKRLIIVLSLAAIALAAAWYGVCRIDAEMECWVESVDSPAKVLATTDYAALARVIQLHRIAEIQYLWTPLDTHHATVREYVCVTVSAAKGEFDTLALWTLESLGETLFTEGETTLAYGKVASCEKELLGMAGSDSVPGSYSLLVKETLLKSTELRKEFEDRDGHVPVIIFSDLGRVSRSYVGDHLCYYDQKTRAHQVSAKRYWKEIQALARKGT